MYRIGTNTSLLANVKLTYGQFRKYLGCKICAQISYFYGLKRVKNYYDEKNWFQAFKSVKNRYQIHTHVKNRYQILTSAKNWYQNSHV